MLTARDLVEMSMGKSTFRQDVRDAIHTREVDSKPIFEIEAEIMNLTKIRIAEIVLTLSDDPIMTAEGMQVLLDNL